MPLSETCSKYRCDIYGTEVTIPQINGITIVCCGQNMTLVVKDKTVTNSHS